MKFIREKNGYYYIVLEILFWSWFPLVTTLTVREIPPVFSSGASALISGIFFFFYVKTTSSFPSAISRAGVTSLLANTFITGVGMYLLIFYAARSTQPGNINLLLMLQILFSIFMFRKFRAESLSREEIAGSLLMMLGAIFVLMPEELKFASGDFLLIVAAFLAPIGNYFAKQARIELSAQFIMLVRSFLAGCIMLILSLLIEGRPPAPALSLPWMMITINGVFLIGLSKVFWIEALHRMPIAKVASFTTITPFFSLLWIYFFLGTEPRWQQIIGGIPLLLGTMLVVKNKATLS